VSDVVVLCYHAVSPDWPVAMAVSAQTLERQVGHLLGRGYVPATFDRAVTDPPGRRTFSVTFDDAFASVYERGYPVLERFGVPATVFVPTDPTNRDAARAWPSLDRWVGTPHEHELAGMSWERLAELARAGWEIGSHTRTHPHLPALGRLALDRELAGSRWACEDRLGVPCRSLAYPYGDLDPRVVDAARVAGYAGAATLGSWRPRPEQLQWPRVLVLRGHTDQRFQARVSPFRRRVKSSSAWPHVVAVRDLARRAS
jgi:peptidoglycan/xylan/chitin deacetylase (PgdA/CDA1 family)